jgi:hypothetical protein
MLHDATRHDLNTAIEGAREDIYKSHTASELSDQAIRVPPEGLSLFCVFFLPAGTRIVHVLFDTERVS